MKCACMHDILSSSFFFLYPTDGMLHGHARSKFGKPNIKLDKPLGRLSFAILRTINLCLHRFCTKRRSGVGI